MVYSPLCGLNMFGNYCDHWNTLKTQTYETFNIALKMRKVVATFRSPNYITFWKTYSSLSMSHAFYIPVDMIQRLRDILAEVIISYLQCKSQLTIMAMIGTGAARCNYISNQRAPYKSQSSASCRSWNGKTGCVSIWDAILFQRSSSSVSFFAGLWLLFYAGHSFGSCVHHLISQISGKALCDEVFEQPANGGGNGIPSNWIFLRFFANCSHNHQICSMRSTSNANKPIHAHMSYRIWVIDPKASHWSEHMPSEPVSTKVSIGP